MTNILSKNGAESFKNRINRLNANTIPQWGKMTPAQMMAHCNVAYEMAYENIHPKPSAIKTFFLKTFLKSIVVGRKPYKKNSSTAPEFKITNSREFDKEKNRLIDYLNHTVKLGEEHFEGRVSHSFGKLNKKEWNAMFAKHLDHHLRQFGV